MKTVDEILPGAYLCELCGCTQSDYEQIAQLMPALTQHCQLSYAALKAVTDHPDSHFYVLRSGERIIACATMCVFVSPTGRKASIEDVIVHPDYQNLGLGRALMDFILSKAREFAPLTLQLTSRPSRQAANALYRKMGFQSKETNFYVLKIDSKE